MRIGYRVFVGTVSTVGFATAIFAEPLRTALVAALGVGAAVLVVTLLSDATA